MIDHLHISNFQVLQDLKIENLKRVNLIAGKNNTGKTTLLDAIRILASNGDDTVINNILDNRGRFEFGYDSSYEALFPLKLINGQEGDGDLVLNINDFFIKREFNSTIKALRNIDPIYTKYFTDLLFKEKSPAINSKEINDKPKDKVIYIPFEKKWHRTRELWENIVLTPIEDDVVRIIMETVEPRLVRMDVGENKTLIRLKDEKKPIPLQSLGDGMQRILLIAIGLASAKNNLLLIDEFEAGLHHSVQEKLWGMIFHYAAQWNIQVFATTHSQDTIRSFYYEGSKPENEDKALFLRLQFDRNDKLEAITYNMERLKNAVELNIETR